MGKAKDVLNILHAIKEHVARVATISDQDWSDALTDADNNPVRIWTKHEPPADWKPSTSGVVVSHFNGNEGCYYPNKIVPRPVSGGFLVINYYRQVALFSSKWEFEGWLPYGIWSSEFTSPERYRHVRGGDITSDESKLALCLHNDHYVKVFNHQTGDHLWTFGDGTPGNAEDNRVYNPWDCVWLPNGNLAVTSYNGTGNIATGDNSNGMVLELDGTDGHLVRVLLEYTDANYGRFNRNGVHRPTGMAMFDNKLYICSIGRDEVGCFDVESGAFDFVRTYKKPLGLTVNDVDPKCCCQGPNNTLIVYSSGTKRIAAVNLSDGTLAWYSGIPMWDSSPNPRNRPHELWDVYGVYWDAANERVLAADHGNLRIMSLTTTNLHTIQYQVDPPSGYRLVWKPDGYDEVNKTLSVEINRVLDIGNTENPGYLLLGWEKEPS